MNFVKISVLLTGFLSQSVWSQSAILLEACNNIENSSKRLACLQEVMKEKSSPQLQQSVSFLSLKKSFTSMQGAVASGISLRNYQNLVLEPAKELANFKSENPNVNAAAIGLLDKALAAYNDAETLWNADIYSSKDGGIFFGRILPYEQLGLGWIVRKYNLQTTTILLTASVSADTSLPKIWGIAKESADSAFRTLGLVEKKELLTELKSLTLPNKQTVVATNESISIFDPLKPNVFDGLPWIWPKNGLVLTEFDGKKKLGIDIDGTEGDSVVAASNGVVVFSGAGLNGYGNLVIIKHNSIYLTAYAHNQTLLVKEGDAVKIGQEIAKMGMTESDQVKLHFEIRMQAKSMNPLAYLPIK